MIRFGGIITFPLICGCMNLMHIVYVCRCPCVCVCPPGAVGCVARYWFAGGGIERQWGSLEPRVTPQLQWPDGNCTVRAEGAEQINNTHTHSDMNVYAAGILRTLNTLHQHTQWSSETDTTQTCSASTSSKVHSVEKTQTENTHIRVKHRACLHPWFVADAEAIMPATLL